MREFDTGATRDSEDGKLDPEGFMHPACMHAYCKYMHRHRLQADGKLRDSDNWQKGIPKSAYMKSLLRHVMEAWAIHRDADGWDSSTPERLTTMEDALCAILFNAFGYLFEVLEDQHAQKPLKTLGAGRSL